MATHGVVSSYRESKDIYLLELFHLQLETSNKTLNSEIIDWIRSGCCLFWIFFPWYLALSIISEMMYCFILISDIVGMEAKL